MCGQAACHISIDLALVGIGRSHLHHIVIIIIGSSFSSAGLAPTELVFGTIPSCGSDLALI
jgi:hypothetical protein